MHPASPSLPAEPEQYLTFQLGADMYAVGILAVKEIIEYPELTAVPMAPPAIRGVINLRGAVVPVLDPLVRFGRPPSPQGKRTCVVIVEVTRAEAERRVLGMVVDAVSEVVDIAPGDIEPPPPFGARVRTDFLRGVAKLRGRFVLLLEPTQMLDLDALDDVLAPDASQPETQAA